MAFLLMVTVLVSITKHRVHWTRCWNIIPKNNNNKQQRHGEREREIELGFPIRDLFIIVT